MELFYKPTFIRQYAKLEKNLQEEVLEKIELFKDISNHKNLRVHKLHGTLKDCYAFSVNYSFRILFLYEKKDQVHLLAIGDHDMYQ
jgi:addiction module RelE/StbE family toxin